MVNNNFTEEQIREAAKNSKSIAEMCRHLNMIAAGGNYGSLKRRIVRYDIDISHFTGSGWNKGLYSDNPNSKGAWKRKLIRERGHQCEKCKNTTWFELSITLELEHIDGDNSNNIEENLLLLCPNCHAQTKTWRRAKKVFVPQNPPKDNPNLICPTCQKTKSVNAKNCLECLRDKQRDTPKAPRKQTKAVKFCSCGEVISSQAQQCTKCAHVKQQRIEWPSVDDLVTRLRDNKESYTSVSKSLGVSDNSVRKYLRKHGIDPKTFQPLDKDAGDQ